MITATSSSTARILPRAIHSLLSLLCYRPSNHPSVDRLSCPGCHFPQIYPVRLFFSLFFFFHAYGVLLPTRSFSPAILRALVPN